MQRYHADNRRFADKESTYNAKAQRQMITYCAVNAHHQNGKSEKRIRDLQEKTRTMILHAIPQWPDAITPHLQPHTLRIANKIRNIMPRMQDGLIPWSIFASTSNFPNLSQLNPFRCSAYVLELQQKKKINKWSKRGRVRIYLVSRPLMPPQNTWFCQSKQVQCRLNIM